MRHSSLAYFVTSEPWKAKGGNIKKVDPNWEDTWGFSWLEHIYVHAYTVHTHTMHKKHLNTHTLTNFDKEEILSLGSNPDEKATLVMSECSGFITNITWWECTPTVH